MFISKPSHLILLCDADDRRRKKIKGILTANNMRVIDTPDSIELLSNCDSTDPSLIILSLQIDRMDAASAIEIIRDKPWLLYTPILLIVGKAEHIPERYLEFGAIDLFRGEIDESDLLFRIHNLIRWSLDIKYLNLRLEHAERWTRRVDKAYRTKNDSLGQAEHLISIEDGTLTSSSSISTIKEALEFFGELTIIYINIEGCELIERRYGWREMSNIIKEIDHTLSSFCNLSLSDVYKKVLLFRYLSDDFIIFLTKGKDGEDPVSLFGELESEIIEGIKNRIGKGMESLIQISFGMSHLKKVPDVNLERMIFRAIKEANIDAGTVLQSELKKKELNLKNCLVKDLFFVLYQPILSVESGKVHGYEVLTRCKMPELSNPRIIFDVAESAGLIWDVSRKIRTLALSPMKTLDRKELLFINLHPLDLRDPQFILSEVWNKFMEDFSGRLVFEITERSAMKEIENFKDLLYPLRRLGYGFAVDDLGSGYAGLNIIAQLEPDFIKFDMGLVRDIHKYKVKRNLIKAMVRFSEDIGCKTIGEGVEKVEEARVLMDLGCHFLQGFLFAPASPPFIKLDLKGIIKDT